VGRAWCPSVGREVSADDNPRMALGENVMRAAIRGDLDMMGTAGEEMHVALANPLGRNSLGLALVSASPEAWETFAVWCAENRHTPPGAKGKEKAVAGAARRTHTRIVTMLGRLADHPGYRGVAMVGTHTELLPARRCGAGRWWPTRRRAMADSDGATLEVRVATLYPVQVERGGRIFTVWKVSDAP
jgi:hypothetical protein